MSSDTQQHLPDCPVCLLPAACLDMLFSWHPGLPVCWFLPQCISWDIFTSYKSPLEMSVYSNVKPVIISLLVVQNKTRYTPLSLSLTTKTTWLNYYYFFLLNFLLPEEYYQFYFIFVLETYLFIALEEQNQIANSGEHLWVTDTVIGQKHFVGHKCCIEMVAERGLDARDLWGQSCFRMVQMPLPRGVPWKLPVATWCGMMCRWWPMRPVFLCFQNAFCFISNVYLLIVTAHRTKIFIVKTASKTCGYGC